MKKISQMVFGTIGISGSWQKVSERTAIATMHEAFEHGIHWIDTSPMYGLGRAEGIINKVLKGKRHEVFLATKCGLQFDNNRMVKDLRPETINREIDRSLKALEVEVIDLYQCHWPDATTDFSETWGAMSRLVEKGKVKWIGLCNYSAEDIELASSIYSVFSLQLPYNLLRNGLKKEILDSCKRNNIHIMGYSPLQCGIISENFTISRLHENDFRKTKKEWFSEKNTIMLESFRSALKEIAIEKSCTVSQLAIAWALNKKEADSVIIGASNPVQIRENILSQFIALDHSELDRCEKAASLYGINQV